MSESNFVTQMCKRLCYVIFVSKFSNVAESTASMGLTREKATKNKACFISYDKTKENRQLFFH